MNEMKKNVGCGMQLLILCVGLSLLPGLSCPALAASFDCQAPENGTEERICANTRLSVLDDELAQVYQKALQLVSRRAKLESAQQRWIGRVRDAAKDSGELEAAYLTRIEELKRMPETKKKLFASLPPPSSIFGRYSEQEPVCVSIPDTDKYDCDNSSAGESFFEVRPGLANTVKVKSRLIFFKDHTCRIEGEAEWVNGVLRLPRTDRSGCVLQLRFAEGKIIAEDPAGLCKAAFCGDLCGFQDIELPKTGPAHKVDKPVKTPQVSLPQT
jgi:uncharacterized protein